MEKLEQRNSKVIWALSGVLVIGAALRFAGLNWNGRHCFHGDESVGVLEPAAALTARKAFAPSFPHTVRCRFTSSASWANW